LLNTHPTLTVLGHDSIQRSLAIAISSGKFSATTIFQGIKGIGKALIANQIAKALLCENQTKVKLNASKGNIANIWCDDCHSCTLFRSNSHPDYYSVDCSNLKTNPLRELLSKIQLAPFCSVARVIIFDNAEDISIQCANLLLKTLEEPRPNSYFILITGSVSKLPSTVISRSQKISFKPLSPEILTKIAEEQRLDLSIPLQKLALLAKGSAATLNLLVNHPEVIEKSESIVRHLIRQEIAQLIQIAQTLGKDKESLAALFLALKAGLCNGLRKEKRLDRLRGYSYFLTALTGAERLIKERNLNAQYILITLFSRCAPLLKESTFLEESADDTLLMFQQF
jgi:DNA polymerase-3 subunit delta'